MKKIAVALLEDDKEDAYLATNMLEQYGDFGWQFIVTHFSSLEDLALMVQKHPYDVVLADLDLPDSTGLMTLIRIREHTKTAPIIVLSGMDDESFALKAIQMGAQDYIPKSDLTPVLFRRAIRMAIEREEQVHALLGSSYKSSTTQLARLHVLKDELFRRIATTQRYERPFALIRLSVSDLLDLNNDANQAANDYLMRKLATLFRQSARQSDFSAEISESEFALVVPWFENEQELADIAERTYSSLSQSTHYWQDDSGDPLPFSLHLGVVEVAGEFDSVEDILTASEVALQRAIQLDTPIHLYSPDDVKALADSLEE